MVLSHIFATLPMPVSETGEKITFDISIGLSSTDVNAIVFAETRQRVSI